ncbi:MAG: hypothetical protein HYY23_15635 [Verrucomicrobia bacterium]|nr:hypothetical protein [Verrucomicrobiota bacterium]
MHICNLPYRRFAIGGASRVVGALDLAEAAQNAILRYGRLKICATPSRERKQWPHLEMRTNGWGERDES